MHRNYHRQQRVAQLIKAELASLFYRDSTNLQFAKINITLVEVSPDQAQAKIFFSLLAREQAEDTLLALNKSSGRFRHLLAKSLNLRVTPQLKFYYDESLQRAAHITELIDSAIKKDRSHHQEEE